MLEVIIGILIGIAAMLLIFIIVQKVQERGAPPLNFDFYRKQAENELIKKKDSYEKEISEEFLEKRRILQENLQQKRNEINNEISFLDKILEEKNQAHENAIKQLSEDFEIKKRELQKKEESFQDDMLIKRYNEIQNYEKEFNSALEQIKADYKEKEQKEKEDFLAFSADINQRKAALTKEIEDYEVKQKAIIDRFKKDEAARQQAEFYKISLTQQEKEDVKKLRHVADELNSPIILYKLIWENYYKNKFSELVGRVVGDNKKASGIYKITNIENGKVYIGQTKAGFENRWRTHIRRGLKAEPTTNNKLYSEMWELGPENFTWEIVMTCPEEELTDREKYFIGFYNSSDWGYNSKT